VVLDRYEVESGDEEAKDLGITMVVCPPYIFRQGSVITYERLNTISNKNPVQPAALLIL
jgi:hypothetical protein